MVRSCLLNWIYTTACRGTTWGYLILFLIPPDHSQIDVFLTTASMSPKDSNPYGPITGFFTWVSQPQALTLSDSFCKQYTSLSMALPSSNTSRALHCWEKKAHTHPSIPGSLYPGPI